MLVTRALTVGQDRLCRLALRCSSSCAGLGVKHDGALALRPKEAVKAVELSCQRGTLY